MNHFLIFGTSYFIFILLIFIGRDSLLAHLPLGLLLLSFPHFIQTYWIWARGIKNWSREWIPLAFPILYVTIFFLIDYFKHPIFSIETLLKVSYLYLLYHFAQQLYGITLWSSMKWGIHFSSLRKHLMRMLFLVTAVYSWLEMETRGEVEYLFFHPVSSWKLSSDYLIFGFALVFCLSVIVVFLSFWDFIQKKNLRMIYLLAPLGLSWLWFIPPLNKDLTFYLPLLHGLQYMPFIFLKTKDLSKSGQLVLAVASVGIGWVFFRWLPFEVSILEGTLWPALILSFLNNHHFIIDGRIWKLRDPANQILLD